MSNKVKFVLPNIEPHELEFIKNREKIINDFMSTIKSVAKFQQGDYLIAHTVSWNGLKSPVVNSYGAPKKFIVIHNDANGIPYMKELNKKGQPYGQLICPMNIESNSFLCRTLEYEFEVDPDFADAIIMEDEKNFEASTIHKMKSDLFKEITNHNKNIKVNVYNNDNLIKFLRNLQVGDILYRSIRTYLTITSLQPIPVSHRNSRIAEDQVFGEAIDSKGKKFDLTARYFRGKAIYTGQPRSYNELKDPK